MFCPNCGTQNDSAATPCKKCGFKLSGISVPKFKGTMMLNSDQTVQELIDEHRRKQTQGRASEPAPRKAPGSSAPPSSLGGTRGPVFQPPRAAAPARGRMGGTMLGVAPQVGGYAPPQGGLTPSVPAPANPAPAAGSDPPQSGAPAPSGALDAPQPTVLSSAAPAGAVETHRAEPRSDGAIAHGLAAEGPSESSVPRPTRPLPAVPNDASEAASVDAPVAVAEVAAADPAAVRAVPATAPLPRASEPAKPASPGEGTAASPPRLRPIDIVLIVFTLGFYGLVLWAKQRKASA